MAIYKEDIVDIEMETGTIHRSFMNHAIGLGDAKGNRFGVRLFRNGVAENVGSATVTGLFMSPDGNNYTISGSGSSSQYHWINGNVAGVILPSSFYAVEGQFTLAIKLSLSGIVTTMRIVDGVVSNTGASGAVVPSSSVPTSDQIIAAYNNAIAVVDSSVRFDTAQNLTNAQKSTARGNIDAAGLSQVVRYDATQELTQAQRQTARTNIKAASITMLAPEFSDDSSTFYDQGDYVIYGQNLWRCKKATTGGTWTGTTDWVKVEAGAEIDNVLKQTAAQFDTSATYSVGDYAIYRAELYRFNVAHTGIWAAEDVTKVKLANELRDKVSDVNSAVDAILSSNEEITFTTYMEGKYITSYPGMEGDLPTDEGFHVTTRAIVKPGEIVKAENVYCAGYKAIAWYDSDDVFGGILVTGTTNSTVFFTIPANARYIRATAKATDNVVFSYASIVNEYSEAYETVGKMKSDTRLGSGKICRTLGYYSKGDGGSALYLISSEQPSGFFETLNNGQYAELILEKDVNVMNYGCYGDGIANDTSAFTNAISAAISSGKRLISPSGKTYLLNHIEISAPITMYFNNSIVKNNSDGYVFRFKKNQTADYTHFNNIQMLVVDCNNGYGIRLDT